MLQAPPSIQAPCNPLNLQRDTHVFSVDIRNFWPLEDQQWLSEGARTRPCMESGLRTGDADSIETRCDARMLLLNALSLCIKMKPKIGKKKKTLKNIVCLLIFFNLFLTYSQEIKFSFGKWGLQP